MEGVELIWIGSQRLDISEGVRDVQMRIIHLEKVCCILNQGGRSLCISCNRHVARWARRYGLVSVVKTCLLYHLVLSGNAKQMLQEFQKEFLHQWKLHHLQRPCACWFLSPNWTGYVSVGWCKPVFCTWRRQVIASNSHVCRGIACAYREPYPHGGRPVFLCHISSHRGQSKTALETKVRN